MRLKDFTATFELQAHMLFQRELSIVDAVPVPHLVCVRFWVPELRLNLMKQIKTPTGREA